MKYLPPLSDDVARELERFQRDHPNTSRTAFIMMPFGNSLFYDEVIQAIRKTCDTFGVKAVRADDRAYIDDLFSNVVIYMHGCGIGIAVFDQMAPSVFNPNVALEVGYMLALGRRICLLKDTRIPSLPVDLIGRLYRPFDPAEVEISVNKSLSGWLCDNDFLTSSPSLEEPLTADNFRAYLRWHFPHEELFDGVPHFNRHWRALVKYDYKTLGDVHDLLARTERARHYLFNGRRSAFAMCQVAHAIALTHDDYLFEPVWKIGTVDDIRNARSLLSPQYKED